MNKHGSKEVVETRQVHKKVYKIEDKNKGMKKMTTKQIKTILTLLYSTTIIASIGLGSVDTLASEIDTNTESVQEQKIDNQILKITKSEKVAEFSNEKGFKKLLKKYQIFDTRTGEQIKYHQLNFKNANFSLNDEKYKVLNSNQEPNVKFNTNEKGYEFTVNFVQSDDYLHSNHLASHKFAYSYDLPADFTTSNIYKKLENQPKIKGYIMWNQESGTYSVNAIQYTLKNQKLEMVFSSIGSSHFSQQALTNFEAAQK